MKQALLLAIFIFTPFLGGAEELVVFSGAGLIKPMAELRTEFEASRACNVRIHYGGSGELFGMLAMGKTCDILIPGAATYTYDALKNGWIIEETIRHIVNHVPVICVPKGNPANIKTLYDLAKPGVTVALGDPNGPAIGRVSKAILSRLDLYENVKSRTVVSTPTVNQLLIYVCLKQVDAAIIWEDLASWSKNRQEIELVTIPQTQNIIKTITTAVTSQGRNNVLANDFNAYITSAHALAIWEKWGFSACTK